MRRLGRDLLLAVLAALPALGAALLGAPGPLALTFNLGPNDQGYLDGFAPLYEIGDQGGVHWASRSAHVRLPLTASGALRLDLRSARILPESAATRVTLGPLEAGGFRSRGGRFEVRRFALDGLRSTPLEVGLETSSQDARGLLVDWLRIEVGPSGLLRLRGAALWRPALLAALVFALLRLSGFAGPGALAGTLPLSLALAVLAWRWPLVLAHVSARLALPVAVVGTLLALLLRRVPRGRWALLVFLLGWLIKGAGVLHPDFFYPDNQLFRRYVLAFGRAEGSLAERGVEAQTEVFFPRYVAGRAYAFPYSPMFAVPFLALPRDAPLVEDALRQAALLAAALEVLLAFGLARLAFGGSAGVGAAVIAVLLPLPYSRLLLSMWPTVFGHPFDVLAIGAAALALRPPGGLGPWLRATLALWLALPLYVSSLFNLGAFSVALAALRRRAALPLLGAYVGGAGLVVLLLYHLFLAPFFQEILPALLAGTRVRAAGDAGAGGLVATLLRIPGMFGWGPPTLALAGLVLLRRRAAPPWRDALSAWALAFGLLTGLRLVGSGLFRDLKELTFVAPLMAVLAGAALEDLWERGRAGRAATLMLGLGLALLCAERYVFYWHDAQSVAMLMRHLP